MVPDALSRPMHMYAECNFLTVIMLCVAAALKVSEHCIATSLITYEFGVNPLSRSHSAEHPTRACPAALCKRSRLLQKHKQLPWGTDLSGFEARPTA